MFIRIVMHFLVSCRRVISIIVSISNKNANTYSLTLLSKEEQFILTLNCECFCIDQCLSSTLALLKSVGFLYGNVIEWFAIDCELKIGAIVFF